MPPTAASQYQRLDVGGLSDVGRKRQRNEDFWGCWEDINDVDDQLAARLGRLYVVSDGVGGNEDGDVASRETVQQLVQLFYDERYQQPVPEHRLEHAIVETSRKVAQHVVELHNDMAATVVAALLINDKLIVANVGDSRAYVVRAKGKIEQLTEDHVEHGNQLTQAMGDTHVRVALAETQLGLGDSVVLCTDGLHDLVRPSEIARIVRRNSARSATRQLIQLANRRAGHDNITVLIVRNGPPPAPIGMYVRLGGVMAGLVCAFALLLGMLNTLAPVQAHQLNSFLGIKREPTAILEPTATLSPLEIKATATTLFVSAEATRGIIWPTLTPLPTRPSQNVVQKPGVPGVPRPTATATKSIPATNTPGVAAQLEPTSTTVAAPVAPTQLPAQPPSATSTTLPVSAPSAPEPEPPEDKQRPTPPQITPTTAAVPVRQPGATATVDPTLPPLEPPTTPPTDVPTVSLPTAQPSAMPTAAQPTTVPTVAPTAPPQPTEAPTTAPAVIPTAVPLPQPTEVPPTAPPVVPTP